MGLAWTADDVGDSVLPAAGQVARQQPGRSRLADRQPYGRHASSPAGASWTAGARHRRPPRRRAMAARKYWT